MDVCASVSTGIEHPFLCFWAYLARKNARVGGVKGVCGRGWHGGTMCKRRIN